MYEKESLYTAVGMPLDVDGFGYGEYNMGFYGAIYISVKTQQYILTTGDISFWCTNLQQG